MLAFQFPTTEAVALSNSVICVSSVVRFIISFRLKHPEKPALAVDYNYISLMLPTLLLGTVIGVEINVFLPQAVILVILTILVMLLGYYTFHKAHKIRLSELSAKRKQRRREA